MDWIKKNPAQFGLAVVSVGLLASSVYLYTKFSGFSEPFSNVNNPPAQKKNVPVVDTATIDAATKAVGEPATWTPKPARLLAGKLYISTNDGKIQQPDKGTMLHAPVPNTWFIKYGLDLLNTGILAEDPDRDGFSNLAEFAGTNAIADGEADATNPIDAKSIPPYHTRLALGQVVNIPFRLRFMSYDLDARNPKNTTVAVNPLDRGNRTQFLQLGADIAGTKFKTDSFVKKETKDADGITKDVSELTIINKESGQKVILPLDKVVDSPESYVIIKYLWAPPGSQMVPDINKQKGQTFTIPPETDKVYKVIDIRPDEVDIQLPSGEKLTLSKGKLPPN